MRSRSGVSSSTSRLSSGILAPAGQSAGGNCELAPGAQTRFLVKRDSLVLFYLVDGARPDVMQNLINEGKLPNISSEVATPGSFRTASSCFTSTTGPAHIPFLMGCFPGTVGIPGIRWLDKKEFTRRRVGRFRLRSYNGIEGPWFNSDLPRERMMIHELFDRSRSIYSMVTRSQSATENLTMHTKLPRYLSAHLNNDWHKVDAAGHRRLMKGLDTRPDFVFAVFPAVDSYSHIKDPLDKETIRAYVNIDAFIGEAVAKLKKQGRWPDTLLVISSDHGLTPTHTHFDLADFFEERGLKTLRYPLIFKHNPDVSVMISGNAMGHVYLHHGIPGRPLYGDEVHQSLGSLLDELLTREEVDFAAWRESDSEFSVASSGGAAKVRNTAKGFSYIPRNGDPFGLGEISKPMGKMESLDRTIHAKYPDALVQISQLFSSSRTGDILIVSKNGYDLRKAWEWPEHRGSHGSLCREHMMVPLILNRRDWQDRPSRTVDLYPSILRWADREVPPDIDGVPLV
jgi:hypothetical protein